MPVVVVVAAPNGLIFLEGDIPPGQGPGSDGIASNVLGGSQTEVEHKAW